MNKFLAIKGHPTRGKEVIELLEMMGGVAAASKGFRESYCYYISEDTPTKYISWDYIGPEEIDKYIIFTLEEFLEKYPFNVGDFVRIPEYESEVRILKMKWCPLSEHIEYLVCPNDEDEWFTADELLEDNDNPNKTRDCKKCGLHFGSIRCFDKDCPHNTPKSYAVGLKDGKVIECGVNKEIVMNENKPLFRTGDVVKLKGCPDENLFWIVMNVIEDGYIFNDGKKYSFDDQHHYEKSNREVINTNTSKMKNVLAELLDHIKNTSKEELEKEFNELEEWSHVGPTVEEFMDFCNKVNKKPEYLKTYEECYNILNDFNFTNPEKYDFEFGWRCNIKGKNYGKLLQSFVKLLICRDAYWKIAGEQTGLGKPWEPDWKNGTETKYTIVYSCSMILNGTTNLENKILAFPTKEMRDSFYENFKDLIESCKELL